MSRAAALLIAVTLMGCVAPQVTGTPTPILGPPGGPGDTPRPLPTPGASPTSSPFFITLNGLGPLRGDWVFALKGGTGATGGRANPNVNQLWAVPLAGASGTVVASWLEYPDQPPISEFPVNDLRRQLSADRRRLVLSAGQPVGTTTRYRIVILDLERGTASAVGPDDADLIRPALSPDGTKIAYVRKPRSGRGDDGLWVMNVDGSGARRVRPGDDWLYTWVYGWTPDSKSIAFDQVDYMPSFVLVDITTGARSNALGFIPAVWAGEEPDWRTRSPAFVAGFFTQQTTSAGESRVVVADRPDGPQRALVVEPNTFLQVGAARWHPTADEILYRRLINSANIEFYTVALSGGDPRRVPLAERPYLATWTPDGEGFVYLSQAPGNFAIYGWSIRQAKRDGSNDREILSVPAGGLSDLVAFRYSS